MTHPALSAAWVLAAGVALAGGSLPAQQTPPAAASPAPPRIPSIFVPPEPLDDSDRSGWTPLFDGATLKGWDGNPEVWRVENGAITAVSTAERRIGSTHLIWQGGEVADFELQVDVRLEGDIHSGIAYRSAVDLTRGRGGQTATAAAGRGRGPALAVPVDPRWTLYGPGFDYDYDRLMAGNVEDRGTDRREVAWRGGIVRTEPGKRPRLIGTLGDADALMEVFKVDQWNRIHVVARGHQLTHIVNGRAVTILVDEDPAYFRSAGLIGLQIEQYGVGRVSFRNISLRK
ncbi:MAG: DUF1080 domain-containing protein [Acidobacteriota bacterium]